MSLKHFIQIIFFSIGLSAFSQNDSIFSKANDAYADANYQEAKRLYLNVVKDGQESSELYFNLGNTFYKLEDIPQSIYYYEKALKLSPQDEGIMNNLSFAERMRLDQFQQTPESDVDKGLDGIINMFSVDSWSYLGIGLLIIAGILFAIFLFYSKPSIKRLTFGLCLFVIVLSVGSFSLAQKQLNNINDSVFAIIFEKEKALLEEPNPKSNVLFDLHEGTKVKILDQFRSYYQVELPDGTLGWLTTENIKVI